MGPYTSLITAGRGRSGYRGAVIAGLAGHGATWASVVSVAGFTAIGSVGFEPVGQVFGAAVYPLPATAAVSCPGTITPSMVPAASAAVTGVPGPAEHIARALDRRIALDRMTGECSDLGGHGPIAG